MWSLKQALFFKSWIALWIWFNQSAGAAAGGRSERKNTLSAFSNFSPSLMKINLGELRSPSRHEEGFDSDFWGMLLSGDFPQTNDLTFLVRQRAMINMLIKGPSVQVLKEGTATSVSVINTIRVAETTQLKSHHTNVLNPKIPISGHGSPSSLLAHYLPIKRLFQIHKANGTALPYAGQKWLYIEIECFSPFHYFLFLRGARRRRERRTE